MEHLAPALQPVVEPVVRRLDTLEQIVVEIKDALDVQFKRTATIQAQLDRVLAEVARLRP